MTELLIAGLAAVAVGVFVMAVRPDDVVTGRLAALRPASTSGSRPGVVDRGEACLRRIGRLVPGDRARVARALVSAAVKGWTPDAVAGCRAVASLVGFGLAAGPLRLNVAVAVLLGWAGYRLPDAAIASRVASRGRQIAGGIPEAADLLAICLRAGSNIPLSLETVGRNTAGPLGQEIRRVVDDISLGVPHGRALGDLAERCGDDDLKVLAALLAGGHRFGAEITPSLEAYSEDVWLKRRRWAEEQARRAPVRLLFPLVLLILPAFILLTLVPLVLVTLDSLAF